MMEQITDVEKIQLNNIFVECYHFQYFITLFGMLK